MQSFPAASGLTLTRAHTYTSQPTPMNTIHNASSLDALMPIELHIPAKEINKLTAFEECVFYLGDVGALIFFAHSALRSASNTKELGWALQLQEAIVYLPSKYRQPRVSQVLQKTLPPDPAITKQQISKWKSANPFVIDFPAVLNEGLAYRLLTVRVSGITETGSKWIGHVIFILEMNKNTFFFCYIDAVESPVVTLELLQKTIHKANACICKRLHKIAHLNYKKEVWLPGDFADDELDACNINFKEVKKTASGEQPNNLEYPNDFFFSNMENFTKEPKQIPNKPPIKKLENWRGHQYKMEITEYMINVKVPKFHKVISQDSHTDDEVHQYVIDSGIRLAASLDRIFVGMNALYDEKIKIDKKLLRKTINQQNKLKKSIKINCKKNEINKKSSRELISQKDKLKMRREESCKNISYESCIGLK